MKPIDSIFIELISTYTKDKVMINRLWDEIKINYSQPSRDYHSLNHLQNLMDNLEPYKEKFEDWEIIQFAIFCHDMVYDVLRNDNEERSAAWAERVMQSLSIELNRIELKGVNVIYWQQMVTTKVTISIPIFLQMLISAF